MGTTLTGTTPQDTYDSLIKVTDNGPLSGTAKYLSDGLGNDSALALSTSNIGVGYTSPTQKLSVAGNVKIAGAQAGNISILNMTRSDVSWSINNETDLRFYSATGDTDSPSNLRVAFTSAGNVGIGTSSPSSRLHVSSTGDIEVKVNSSAGAYTSKLTLNAAGGGASVIDANGGTQPRLIFQNNGTAIASITNGGLCFNADTAAANALDDYEEGTWTPNFTLDAGSVSAYTSSGSYTKIGRQVSATMTITFTTTVSATINEITGLPFTAQNLPQNAIGAVRESSNTGTMWQWRINANSTQGLLRKYDNTQALSNGDTFIGTLTYFV